MSFLSFVKTLFLKPCPLCGSKRVVTSSQEYYEQVICKDCGFFVTVSENCSNIWKLWNNRCFDYSNISYHDFKRVEKYWKNKGKTVPPK